MALDNILYINSASIAILTATGSLNGTADTASYAITASYVAIANVQTASYVENAQTASYVETAQTASYYNIFPKFKSGTISASSFGGTPLTASVSFTTAYNNTLYSVTIAGGDARVWTVENMAAANFIISTNSTQPLSDYVRWMTIGNGEV